MLQMPWTTKHLCLGLVLAGACAAPHAQAAPSIPGPPAPPPQRLQAACSLDALPDASLDHVHVRAWPALPGDLPYYEARSALTGARVRIYHDPDLAPAAAAKSACLMGMLDLLSGVVPEARRGMVWSPMVITRNADYIPLKQDGELRWPNVFSGTGWSPAALDFLMNVMPHEEVHLIQRASGASWPRWFEEGHAEWANLQVTEQVNPDSAREQRELRMQDLRRLDAPRLGAWGGLSVKPEAIERQLSPEDRERRAKDPSYNPPGPFKFGSDDLMQDNADELGRYGAALALFDGLEQRHGRAAVRAWVSAVLASKDAGQIAPLARQLLGEDIAQLLD
ncbi:hypothetical protein [Massilia haematophila]|uniref:Uncharacterized protein n=1 Tax=Massilia haematophila TaxID=457923 RepID=A0ABV7PIH8_9BURK